MEFKNIAKIFFGALIAEIAIIAAFNKKQKNDEKKR